MAANGNFSVVVVRCFLLHRSRRATVPALPGPAREGHRARRPGGLAAPGVDAAGLPPRQIAVALSHVQAPEAGGHVSRPRRAGHLLLGNIGDVSRNCQHDMSRNSQLGRLSAYPFAAAAVGFRGAGAGAWRRLTGAVRPRDPAGSIGDLVEGIGRRISACRRPALARQAGSPVTVPGGGARMPTASGLPVARRDAALVQARRAATSTSSSPCCDDDQDAVGERPRPEW